MAGYENGQLQNTGIPSLEMLIENGKTKARLNNTVDAKKDFETAIQYYPEDYRAYYELLKLISKNFTVPCSFYSFNSAENDDFKKCYSALLAMQIPEDVHRDIVRYQIGVSNRPENVGSEVDDVYLRINKLLEQSKHSIDKNSLSVVNYDMNIQKRKQELTDKQNSKDNKSDKDDTIFEKLMAFIFFALAGFFLLSSFVTIPPRVLGLLAFISAIIFAIIGVVLGGLIGFVIADVLFVGMSFVLRFLYPSSNGKYTLVVLFAGLGILFVWLAQKTSATKFKEQHEKQLEEDKKIRDVEKQIESDVSLKSYNIESYHKEIKHNLAIESKANNLKDRLDSLLQNSDIGDRYKFKYLCKTNGFEYNYINDEFEDIKKEVDDICAKQNRISI